jgi:hypothetical protein
MAVDNKIAKSHHNSDINDKSDHADQERKLAS